jgi:CheY-like chemotaxis protein
MALPTGSGSPKQQIRQRMTFPCHRPTHSFEIKFIEHGLKKSGRWTDKPVRAFFVGRLECHKDYGGYYMKRILFIDDDDGIRDFVSKILSRLGYEVKVACDGEEGIELLKNGDHFKVVITDIRMPRKDGNEVAKYIKHSFKSNHTSVVAITGFAQDVEREWFDCFLEKPFKIKDLIDVIHSFQ